MKHMLRWICVTVIAAAATCAAAQNYPTKPVRMIMPNAPGIWATRWASR